MKLKAVELEKAYDPKEFEQRIYQEDLDSKSFKPAESGNGTFTMVMPPPNVTGILHMGHALNNTLPDILIRYNRMKGVKTLWVPGTDHAGIATQNIVERQLAKEGLTRNDLGREKFIERTWTVKEKHHDIIIKQLQKMGCSCDWDRERFTMDEGLSEAVREAFVSLYEKGLIYKGNYLVNYCPHCGTALADDEVEHENVHAKLYDVNYKLADGSGVITVATTRPETLFGDVAVAVNPEDERCKALVGRLVCLPLTDRQIPIIADSFVEAGFGTGFVKITPAHDPNDWECSKRHSLPSINILTPDGKLNDNVPEKYRNMDVLSARKAVCEELKEQGLLINEKPYDHEVGHCYRCHNAVEPYLSEQWFVRMRSMADKALKAWRDGEITFYPKHWETTYEHWLENIHDWCISRQLWWGHRIPVWYCHKCGKMIVSRTDVHECPDCHSTDLTQDTDVLDTWFSSWLWPFSTLGWPNQTKDMEDFYPTSTLVTGYDIIFFWVSKMIMAGLEFTGKVPFKDIYITSLVRDKQGRKMSKSLGNGIDPLDVIEQYGSDAMKFTLAFMASQGQDILIDMDAFRLGSRFANKVWNASRYLLMNLEGRTLIDVKDIPMNTMDKWIYHRFNEAVKATEEAYKAYKFNEAAQVSYDFFWNDFCDWYVEASKKSLYSDDENEKDRAMSLLLDLLAKSLKLMHPLMCFITEEIYSKLPGCTGKLINAQFPSYDQSLVQEEASALIETLKEAVRLVRTVRSDLKIEPEKKIKVILRPDKGNEAASFFTQYKALMAGFMNSDLSVDQEHDLSIANAMPVAGRGFELYVFVKDAIDADKEIASLEKEIEKTQKLLEATEKKLSNSAFLSAAKPEAVDKERAKKAEFEEKIEKASKHIKVLAAL
ncbi:MAG: valine--tRNA ligase [Sphaerochaetaceae bacterium]|jgi:valyl-tRNA synthetase|nr:valine--tRNA ligase [Sphaerochaetaceae bacterium]